jgi:hypothetical protein
MLQILAQLHPSYAKKRSLRSPLNVRIRRELLTVRLLGAAQQFGQQLFIRDRGMPFGEPTSSGYYDRQIQDAVCVARRRWPRHSRKAKVMASSGTNTMEARRVM